MPGGSQAAAQAGDREQPGAEGDPAAAGRVVDGGSGLARGVHRGNPFKWPGTDGQRLAKAAQGTLKPGDNPIVDVAVGVLGPLQVCGNGRPVALGAPKQRAVLAVLTLHAGATVSTDRLVDEIWGGAAPRAARSVQVYVSALRDCLGPGGQALETVGRGYRLAVTDEQVDARRFERAAAEARALYEGGKPHDAAEVAAAALALWRGPVLADLPDLPLAQAERARLEAVRLETLEVRLDADLALGRAVAVVGNPRTSSAGIRCGAAARAADAGPAPSGRQADALKAYRSGRDRLVDEWGSSPASRCRTCTRRSCVTTRGCGWNRLSCARAGTCLPRRRR